MTDSISSRWRKMGRSKTGLRIMALGIAIFIWYAVRQATSYETLIKGIPVQIKAREGWAVLERSASTVDVLFSGTLQDLQFLDRSKISVEVAPGKESTDGRCVAAVSGRNVRYAGGARVAHVEPAVIAMRLDREEDKRIAVKPDFVGTPPEDIEVVDVTCDPASVLVHGSAQRLREVSELRTQPVELDGRIRSFQVTRPVLPPSEKWSARAEPEEVRVLVSLAQRKSDRAIPDIPVRVLNGGKEAASLRCEPAKVTVRLEGDPRFAREIAPDLVVAFIDAELVRGTGAVEVPVRVAPPLGYRVVGVSPPVVRVQTSGEAER